MRTLKRFAAVAMAGAMMAGSAMTAMAAETNYFYVYENGVFGPARMGQDCVKDADPDGDFITLELQDASYVMGGTTYTGRITDAFIDENGNLTHDEGEDSLMVDDTTIEYDQDALSVEIGDESYANFCIEVTILTSTGEVVYRHNPQSVYVPIM